MENIVDIAKNHAIKCHLGTCHEYDGKPYTLHLRMVEAYALKYKHLVPLDHFDNILAGAWLHDVQEDCRQTYNDILEITNFEVAEIVYALTNEKGKTRKQRANDKYYEGILETPFAVFVKLCDRLANVAYSKTQKSSMFDKYKSEHNEFVKSLKTGDRYDDIW